MQAIQQQVPRVSRTPGGRGRLVAAAVVGGVLAVGLGFALGRAGSVSGGQLTSVQHKLAAADRTIAEQQSAVANADSTVASAQQAAKNALSTAEAKVSARYRSEFAALKRQQQILAGKKRAVAALAGQIQASGISADGVYLVGKDIKAGTWHTSGGAQCYFATLGSTDTSNILDNNNFNGPETVDVSSAFAFEISGGCTWYRVG